jgi:hypothetical protein
VTLRFLANNNTSLLELEDSNYINNYKDETEDNSIKYKDIKVMDFNKGINRDRSNKE